MIDLTVAELHDLKDKLRRLVLTRGHVRVVDSAVAFLLKDIDDILAGQPKAS